MPEPHQDSPKVPGWPRMRLARPRGFDLTPYVPQFPLGRARSSYEVETYIPISALLSDEVVETATRKFTTIHWHNAPLKYGAHARDTMRKALQAAIEQVGGADRG